MKTFRIFLLSVMLASTTSTALASVVKLYGGENSAAVSLSSRPRTRSTFYEPLRVEIGQIACLAHFSQSLHIRGSSRRLGKKAS